MTEKVDDFLEHYGVKGMRWGVSRASDGIKTAVGNVKERRESVKAERVANRDGAAEKGYSKAQRKSDFDNLGIRGVRRVEKRVVNGESIAKARTKEYASSTAKGLAITGLVLGAPIAFAALNAGAGNLASNINAKRGAQAAAKLFADDKGLTSYKTVSLAFDAATNTFK